MSINTAEILQRLRKESDFETIGFRIPVSLASSIRAISKKLGCNQSELATEAFTLLLGIIERHEAETGLLEDVCSSNEIETDIELNPNMKLNPELELTNNAAN